MQPFYLHGEIKLLYYRLLLAAERIDAAELLFLLAQEKGVGAKALAAAEAVLREDKNRQPLAALAAATLPKLPKILQQKILAISELNELAAQLAQEESVTDAVDLLCEHYKLAREDPELIRFRQIATSAPSLPAFAEHLRRHQDSLIYDERAEAVLLATLHAAKGLEFRAVFMVGCEEGLLPLRPRGELNPEAEQEHIQEERRLFFVGMTRAAEVLYLTGAKERLGFAGIEQRTPSRFLSEIPPELLKDPLTAQKQKKKRVRKQLSLF